MTATQDLTLRVKAAVGLGPNADAVADRLRARELKGEQCGTFNCPLARAIQAAIPEATRVIVGGTYVIVRVGDLHVWVDLPPAAVKFVRGFDDGYGPYLDLVAPAVTR